LPETETLLPFSATICCQCGQALRKINARNSVTMSLSFFPLEAERYAAGNTGNHADEDVLDAVCE